MVEIVPVRVVEIVPVRVVEIVPVLVVEIVPVRVVVEIVPAFARVVVDSAVITTAAHTIDLAFFITLLLVILNSGVLESS